MRVDGSHVAAHVEVTEGDSREDGHGAVPFPPFDDRQQGVNTEQVIAAAEEVVEQVELADNVQQVEQFGGGVEEDEIVAASIAENEVVKKAWPADSQTLLTGVTTCVRRHSKQQSKISDNIAEGMLNLPKMISFC